jgi:hypothetical protein
MATLTKAEIRNRVLQRMRVLGQGQTASAEEAAHVDQHIDLLHNELEARGLARIGTLTWTVDTIPDYVAEAYTAMAAFRASPLFGRQTTYDEYTFGENLLRRVATAPVDEDPIEATYY